MMNGVNDTLITSEFYSRVELRGFQKVCGCSTKTDLLQLDFNQLGDYPYKGEENFPGFFMLT